MKQKTDRVNAKHTHKHLSSFLFFKSLVSTCQSYLHYDYTNYLMQQALLSSQPAVSLLATPELGPPSICTIESKPTTSIARMYPLPLSSIMGYNASRACFSSLWMTYLSEEDGSEGRETGDGH